MFRVVSACNQQAQHWHDIIQNKRALISLTLAVAQTLTPALEKSQDLLNHPSGIHAYISVMAILDRKQGSITSSCRNLGMRNVQDCYRLSWDVLGYHMYDQGFIQDFWWRGRSLWGTATASYMSMRLYKFCFGYETKQIFKFSGGRGNSRAPLPLYETLVSIYHLHEKINVVYLRTFTERSVAHKASLTSTEVGPNGIDTLGELVSTHVIGCVALIYIISTFWT